MRADTSVRHGDRRLRATVAVHRSGAESVESGARLDVDEGARDRPPIGTEHRSGDRSDRHVDVVSMLGSVRELHVERDLIGPALADEDEPRGFVWK